MNIPSKHVSYPTPNRRELLGSPGFGKYVKNSSAVCLGTALEMSEDFRIGLCLDLRTRLFMVVSKSL